MLKQRTAHSFVTYITFYVFWRMPKGLYNVPPLKSSPPGGRCVRLMPYWQIRQWQDRHGLHAHLVSYMSVRLLLQTFLYSCQQQDETWTWTVWFCITSATFWVDIGYIDHLYTRLGTKSNYSVIANLHTLHITTAHAKSFPACCVFTSRFLLTVSNGGDS
jgi:hypothetical protein